MTAVLYLTVILRKLVKWFYICFAIAAISLAIIVQAGRSFSYLLADYPAQISRYLSQEFQAKVQIGALHAQWDGLKPTLDIQQLQITSLSNQPIVALHDAHLRLDLLDSLLHLRLVWSSLTLGKVEVTFEQIQGGLWQIPGLPKNTNKPPEELAQLDSLIDMLLLSQRIEFKQTQLSFRFASGEQTQLQSPSLRMENLGDFHRLAMQVDVDNRPKTLMLTVEVKGDPRHKESSSSKAFLQLNQFPTSEPIAAVTALLLKGINAEVHSEGTLSASLWFASKPQREGFDLVGSMDVQRLNVPVMARKLALNSFSTEIVGSWLYGGKWQLALQNIAATINNNKIEKVHFAASAASENAPVILHMPSINLERLSLALDSAGVYGEARLRDVMRKLNPRGELHNVEFSIPLKQPRDWQLQANLVQVGSGAWQGVPALEKVDGFVQAGQRGGHVDINSMQGFSMHYDPTYRAPMEFTQAKGQVAWWLQPEKNQIYVNSGALEFSNGDEKAKGYMWLALPWQRNSGDIDLYLHIGATQLNASLYQKYTPAVVPKSLLTWLGNSIGEQNTGIASEAGFIYRGTLNTPVHAARSHQLFVDVNHAQLNYHPEWPALSDINGRLLVNDEKVDASVDSAKLFSSDVGPTQISVHPNPIAGHGALLSVKGTVDGTAYDGLRVLRESMLRQYIGANMDSWKLTGNMHTQVNIAVPLEQGAPGASQQIDIDLVAPLFEIGNLKLSMRDINGHISYNQDDGVTSQNLTGWLFDQPVNTQLSTHKLKDFSQTWIDVTGEVESQALAAWSLRPEVLYLNGKMAYSAHVELNHRTAKLAKDAAEPEVQNEIQNPFAVVTVSSSLTGVAIDLPAPYGKTTNEERPLIFKMSLFDKRSRVDVHYGDNLQTLLELEPHNNTLLNANIALGSAATLSDKPQFLLSGVLPTLDIEPWKKVQQRYINYSQLLDPKSAQEPQSNPESAALVAGLPFKAAVLLEHYQVGPLLLKNVNVQAERLAAAWRVQFANPMALGEVLLPNDSSQPLQINLQNLHLTHEILEGKTTIDMAQPLAVAPEKDQTATAPNLDPRSLPLANVSVNELFLDDKNYGNWSLHVRPNKAGVLFEHIHGTVRGVTVSGASKAEDGAKLSWQLNEQGAQTHFTGALSATDLSAVLLQWQKPDMLESSTAQFTLDAGWAGDPQDFSLKKLSGDMDILIEKGRFKRNPSVGSDGFLRLMATLNFDSIARRLRLDFSDLYQSGLAYDNINGKVNFQPGTMTFAEPLVLQTPSSRLQLAGKLDLEKETINARLVATLPIAGNFTFFTALVTGLPAAAGIYVVSKLFKKQVDQATSLSYRIEGGWDNPQMNFDRLFESEESLRESVGRTEKPKKIKRQKQPMQKSDTKTAALKNKKPEAAAIPIR